MHTKRELKELILVNKNLAEELFITHKELVFQNKEKEKRAVELIITNKKLSEELEIAHEELAFQNEEKEKRAAELIVAKKELAFQEELDITNSKLLAQYAEKAKRAEELIIKNNELKQLLQLNADKDKFISILAHDLSSPFNSILGFLNLLTENIYEYDIAEIEKDINIISDSAQRVHNLLESILMWTRAESGLLLFKPQVLHLKTIAFDILELLKPSADKKFITINDMVTEELTIVADPEMLKTVLRNLLSNAIKFTNKGGQVNIDAQQTESNIIITVSDNGIGIAPGKQNKLFDISQIHATTGTANEIGTGLGLLLCKDLIAKHDGIICVESKEGKGSEFKFTIPIIKNLTNKKNITVC